MRGGRLNQGGDLPPDGGVADGNRTFFEALCLLEQIPFVSEHANG
jgi:hypothetical protein